MFWLIVILLLLSRGKAPAPASTPPASTQVNPATGRVINPNLAIAGLTEVSPGVFMPDQVRDTTSKKIHAAVSLGPSIGQQAQTLFNSSFSADPNAAGDFLGAFNASFDLNSPGGIGGAVDPAGTIGNPTGEFHTDFV